MTEILHSGLNSYAQEMYMKMEQLGREKWAGYKVHLLDRWFSVTRLKCPAYVGSLSVSSPNTKQRWFLKKDAIPFAGTWVSSADLARLYLSIKFGEKRRRITTPQWKNFYETNRSMPLWADPLYLDYAYYIDVRSAYWTIMRAVGWNVDYMPGKHFAIKDPITVNDFPFPQNKMARNCLVSISADGQKVLKFWTGDQLLFKKGGNGLVNKMLYCFICDVLNGIASDAIEAGAVYSYTDGFIAPSNRRAAVEQAIEAWGVSVAIKREGECEILSPGGYKFGSYETRKFKIQREHRLHKINPVHKEWLRKRFSRAAEYNRISEAFNEDDYRSRIARLPYVKET